MNDPDYIGNYTKEHYSPRNLMSSTIGDELKIASKGRSDVYSIAPNAESAILSAGHAAERRLLDGRLQWKMGDHDLLQRNTVVCRPIQQRAGIALRTAGADGRWTPSLPLDRFNAFPYVLDDLPFKYTFKENTNECFFNH